jgi:hypothetical protein
VKLILFEKSRVELEFVFSIFTTRVRKHLGNSTSFLPSPRGRPRKTIIFHVSKFGKSMHRKMAKAEPKYGKNSSTRRSTPRHPIDMVSTVKPPDPMPCALAAIDRVPRTRLTYAENLVSGDLLGACGVRVRSGRSYVRGAQVRCGCAARV